MTADITESRDGGNSQAAASGKPDAAEAALLAQEDAAKDATLARRRRGGPLRHHQPLIPVMRLDWEAGTGSAFESRFRRWRRRRWGEELWPRYARAYEMQLAAMDVEVRTAALDPFTDGWDAAWLIDLRYWEPNPKVDPADPLERGWRPRSQWIRFWRLLTH